MAETLLLPVDEIIPFLAARVADHAEVLHGSPWSNLPELQPRLSNYVRLGGETDKKASICATNIAELAIFYATVKKTAHIAGLHRACGIRRDRSGGHGFGYFLTLSDAAKELVRRREQEFGLYGAVYHLRKEHCKEQADDEWWALDPISDPPSIAVTSACLPFDIYDLPSTTTEYEQRHFARLGTPPETPVEAVAAMNIRQLFASPAA